MTGLGGGHDVSAPPCGRRRLSIVRWGWFGTGLALAGAVAAGWGYALRWSLVEVPWAGVSFGLLAVVVMLGLLVGDLVTLVRRTARLERDHPAVSEALITAGSRANLTAVVMGLLAVYGLVRMQRGFAGGLPEGGDVLFGIGMALATIGLVMVGKAVADLTTRSLAGLGAGLLAVAAVVAAGCLAAATLPAESVTSTGPASAAPPATVHKIAWQWRRPHRPVRNLQRDRLGPAGPR
ncbi:hypothetical protein [Nonomuraea candida]|uniref:hypothetical protein n=1 Tax=Nonomuraea candida TaxID=359159 RepID=UPI0005BE85F8|nr:hypothetical protein [Nonomuraea candida]